MCDTCGCGQPGEEVTIQKPGKEYTHDHGHSHTHDHHHDHEHHHHHDEGKTIEVQVDVMAKNNLMAERNRGFFEAKNIIALNLVSSPGSGKTTLLEKTITALKDKAQISVIEGDQQTLNDANRIDATGAPVVQVNTGNGCHLDSDMINKSLKELDVQEGSFLFIENVGNLVCPALFDLGEENKVVIMSTTEGEDKPLKYPTMFSVSDVCIINKTDLLPYLDFDVEKFKEYALQVNHHLTFFEVSAKTGDGMQDWLNYLETKRRPSR